MNNNLISYQAKYTMLTSRDPSEKDKANYPFWLNLSNNRIFKYQGYENDKHIWEHLKEIEDEK